MTVGGATGSVSVVEEFTLPTVSALFGSVNLMTSKLSTLTAAIYVLGMALEATVAVWEMFAVPQIASEHGAIYVVQKEAQLHDSFQQYF